jgi:hypothetical protein
LPNRYKGIGTKASPLASVVLRTGPKEVTTTGIKGSVKFLVEFLKKNEKNLNLFFKIL